MRGLKTQRLPSKLCQSLQSLFIYPCENIAQKDTMRQETMGDVTCGANQRLDQVTNTCMAIWDHVTVDPEELQFKCGDLIEILDNSDKNWWKGKVDDCEGWFPNIFVQVIHTFPYLEQL